MATIEQLGFSRLEALGTPRLRSIRTVGGGSKNRAWEQMRKERLKVPFLQPLSGEAAAGAAMLVLTARKLA